MAASKTEFLDELPRMLRVELKLPIEHPVTPTFFGKLEISELD